MYAFQVDFDGDVAAAVAAADTFGHSRMQDGYTALIWAAENGHVECVQLLLDAFANANSVTKVRAFTQRKPCLFCVYGYISALFGIVLWAFTSRKR